MHWFSAFISHFYIRVFTWFKGQYVGQDSLGNHYYRQRGGKPSRSERRWVLYKNSPDASLVSPQWYGWLHHTWDEPLKENDQFHQSWQKPHHKNLTGTSQAYLPPGHLLGKGQRDKATGDYESWDPSLKQEQR